MPPPASHRHLVLSAALALAAAGAAAPGCGQSARDRHNLARSRVHLPVVPPEPTAEVRLPTTPPGAPEPRRSYTVVPTGGD